MSIRGVGTVVVFVLGVEVDVEILLAIALSVAIDLDTGIAISVILLIERDIGVDNDLDNGDVYACDITDVLDLIPDVGTARPLMLEYVFVKSAFVDNERVITSERDAIPPIAAPSEIELNISISCAGVYVLYWGRYPILSCVIASLAVETFVVVATVGSIIRVFHDLNTELACGL